MGTELPDHVARNRARWDEWAREYEAAGQRNWAREEPAWGIWGVPESQVRMFPDDVAGLDVIELGCGTAYVSAWLARRGAKPVGIDNSEAQLATATRLQQEFGLAFALLHGNAEQTPFPDRSFDLAISEYGASIWCDPYRWIPEAARVLRPGGKLIFLANAALLMLCALDEEDRPVSDRLLRRSGFEVEDLIEIRPPDGSSTRYTFVTLEWAQRVAMRRGMESTQGRLRCAAVGGDPAKPRARRRPRRKGRAMKDAERRAGLQLAAHAEAIGSATAAEAEYRAAGRPHPRPRARAVSCNRSLGFAPADRARQR